MVTPPALSLIPISQALIELYARRRQATGYAFPPDGDWQRDFETRFDYDETDDQLNATCLLYTSRCV